MKIQQLLGIGGSVLLFMGMFAPIEHIPQYGSISYFRDGRGVGVLVLLLAIASFILVLQEMYKWLWITGGVSLAVTLYTFVNKVNDIRLLSDGYYTLQKYGAGGGLEPPQLGFGWGLLFAGTGLLISAAFFNRRQFSQNGSAQLETINKSMSFFSTPEGLKKASIVILPSSILIFFVLLYIYLFRPILDNPVSGWMLLLSLISIVASAVFYRKAKAFSPQVIAESPGEGV